MKGKIIDTVDDPLLIQYLFDNFAKSSTIKSEFYQNIELALDDLQNGKINVFFLDKKSADYWVSNNNQQFKFIGQEIPIGFGYAIVGGAGNQALINVVNNALTTMENDGSYITIYTTYFGSKMVSGKTMPAAR